MATAKTIPTRIASVCDFRLPRRASRFCASCLVWVLVCALVPACIAQQKKRVAVLNFDYGTVQSSVAAIFGSNQDVGKGISDLLVQKLVQDGKYSLIERNAIDKILGEQNFANSDRVDSSTAAKIGKILGVDAVIMGSITQFGRDDKNTTVGGGALGGYGSKFGIGGVGKHNAKAVVGISARLVDTTTAEILAAVTGTGQSTRSGTSLIGAGGGGGNAAGGGYDMSSSNFADTILGEAVHQAVDSMATQLDDKAASLPTRKIEINGVVADVTGNVLVLNVGSKDGLKVGDTLDISRPIKTGHGQGAQDHYQQNGHRSGDGRGCAVGYGKLHRSRSCQSRRCGQELAIACG